MNQVEKTLTCETLEDMGKIMNKAYTYGISYAGYKNSTIKNCVGDVLVAYLHIGGKTSEKDKKILRQCFMHGVHRGKLELETIPKIKVFRDIKISNLHDKKYNT